MRLGATKRHFLDQKPQPEHAERAGEGAKNGRRRGSRRGGRHQPVPERRGCPHQPKVGGWEARERRAGSARKEGGKKAREGGRGWSTAGGRCAGPGLLAEGRSPDNLRKRARPEAGTDKAELRGEPCGEALRRRQDAAGAARRGGGRRDRQAGLLSPCLPGAAKCNPAQPLGAAPKGAPLARESGHCADAQRTGQGSVLAAPSPAVRNPRPTDRQRRRVVGMRRPDYQSNRGRIGSGG